MRPARGDGGETGEGCVREGSTLPASKLRWTQITLELEYTDLVHGFAYGNAWNLAQSFAEFAHPHSPGG